MSESRKAFLNGVRAEIPLLIGVFPFGMIYGALALNAGLSTLASQLMSSIVFICLQMKRTRRAFLIMKKKALHL